MEEEAAFLELAKADDTLLDTSGDISATTWEFILSELRAKERRRGSGAIIGKRVLGITTWEMGVSGPVVSALETTPEIKGWSWDTTEANRLFVLICDADSSCSAVDWAINCAAEVEEDPEDEDCEDSEDEDWEDPEEEDNPELELMPVLEVNISVPEPAKDPKLVALFDPGLIAPFDPKMELLFDPKLEMLFDPILEP